MSTITVKQYVMLLTSQSIICTASCHTPDQIHNPYKYATPICCIICADGTSLSVQAHGGCHVRFADVPDEGEFLSWYALSFGRELTMCETDCEDLDQYGINTIEEIEAYVESHGGIDIEATTANAITKALKSIERYTNSAFNK